MKHKSDILIEHLLSVAAIVLSSFALVYGGLYALDVQAENDEAAAQIERLRHANECNNMIGAHRRECLKELEVTE